ncbi:hypothetical protein QBZ16_002059 [Prototheca wickerhamii]|uniref:Abscisic acid G-protein coupled receptor-like domain-containing protein n=1 Tax=Prototheca wickerhamii TaxID=3111 RepID=A0AAD9MI62_PROWI|nr:hypothetical protein QBZ16_002059 [Prototheca wickerhamii]
MEVIEAHGWLFLRRSDYGSSGVLDRSQQTLFSLVFSLCCHQLFLLVCQVLNLLDPRYCIRGSWPGGPPWWRSWASSLIAIPFVKAQSLTSSRLPRAVSLGASCAAVALFVLGRGEVAAAEERVAAARAALEGKRRRLAALELESAAGSGGGGGGAARWLASALGALDAGRRQGRALRAEAAALEMLVAAQSCEAAELRRERRRALEARTLAGHARNALGYALSVYCVYRMLAALRAMLPGGGGAPARPGRRRGPLPARFVARWAGGARGPPPVLLTAELLGFHAISTLLLLRRQLPPRHRAALAQAMGLAALGGAAEDGAVDTDAFQAWFNRLFLGTALGTLGMYWAQVRQKSAELADRLPLYRATDD